MTLTLSDANTSLSLELYNAQSFDNQTEGQLSASPPSGFDSTEAYLTSLEQQGNVTIQGAVTAGRLTGTAGFSSDPATALAEWAATLETFVDGAQGDGYQLQRGYRGDSFQGLIPTVQYTFRGGETYEIGYSLEFLRGQGTALQGAKTVPTVSPGGSLVLDGTTIPSFQEFQMEKSENLEVYRRTFAESPDDNDVYSNAGATRTIRITGRVEGDASARNTFDAAISDSIGQDELVTLEEPFTGRSFEGMIRNYDATDEAGRTRLGDFGIEFVEGTE